MRLVRGEISWDGDGGRGCVDGRGMGMACVRRKKYGVKEWGLLVGFYKMLLFKAWGDGKILIRKNMRCVGNMRMDGLLFVFKRDEAKKSVRKRM
ncbi:MULTISPECIES: hypothetical protein [Bartonella]|uniref:hypothetical protein n=1 Tax=Bartonella TaxID=773 RepID=UPI002361D075|nr:MULTISPECIES: hypothetical protein [Bartonella]